MRDTEQNKRSGPMLPAGKLYRRTSAKGVSYLMGRLGGLRVLIMPKRDGDDGDHSHNLLFAEATERAGGDTR